ncbi:unnamed protein product [Leptidea sinapis]|uniref:Chitin-binding type-2 domain-containing protein n=1 Tax=Leptidea sinapis TaxID=189913 RepID=A0A5E4PQV0_9NEOP|nr:unnamed protein product [Leptidea sinapis]
MARVSSCVAVLLIISAISQVKPDEISLESLGKVDELYDQSYGETKNKEKDADTKSGQREKRFYNFYDPYVPASYDNTHYDYVKRDQNKNFGNYGTQNPLDYLISRLQEITNTARQNTYLPPPPPPVPTYIPFPIVYLPNFCSCNNNNNLPPPTTTQKPCKGDDNEKTTMPSLINRLGDGDDDDMSDGSRPISFKPITPKTPLSRPPPPVEHGSVQAGMKPSNVDTQNNLEDVLRFPDSATVDPIPPEVSGEVSSCDRAAIVCCHAPNVTYLCFKNNYCSSPSEKSCDAQNLSEIAIRLSRQYKRELQ